jgi:hypothetical protein
LPGSNSKRGSVEIEAEFGELQKPTTFGNEYLTYVLWAISPEGRAVNLGEVVVGGNDRSKLHVTSDLQAFAMIVTAEPYYAVREPSNVVVLENVVRESTKGTSEAVNAKYELMERGGYIPTGYKFDPVILNAKLPLEFFEARNALRIAQSEGAEQYAPDSYQHAVQLMNTADSDAIRQAHRQKAADRSFARRGADRGRCTRDRSQENGRPVRLANERQDSADAQANSQAQAARIGDQAQSDAAAAQSPMLPMHRPRREGTIADMAANQAASASAVSAAQADAEQSRLARTASPASRAAGGHVTRRPCGQSCPSS